MAYPEAAEDGRNVMRPVLEQYAEDVAALRRYCSIPLAANDLGKQRAFFQAAQGRLREMDFAGMGHAERLDYLLFRSQLAYELHTLERREEFDQATRESIPFADAIVRFAQRRRSVERIDPRACAGELAELARLVDAARRALEEQLEAAGHADEPPVRQTAAQRSAFALDRLRKALKEAYEFYHDYDPQFTWWASVPYERADKALDAYATFLREEVLGLKDDDADDPPVVGTPVGRQALLDGLERAMVPYNPEELIAIGNAELSWCEREMVRASRELGCGDEWHDALEQVKQDFVAPGEQPYLIRDLATEAIQFLEEHQLITIPALACQTWRMDMMSPERQKVNPFFTGGETITVSYPTSTMAHEQKLMSLRGNNAHFSRATVQHELIPGHHLQGFMARRHRPYRRVFATPFFWEGWALHWEMLLWDLGFAHTPADRIGMLFWRMHRCARIIFSLRFHLGEMTAEECIEFLIARVGFEPANASGEVRRSFGPEANPLYQCAYMVGGLQFRALHRELVGSGRMSACEFHDALLREGAIPVEMVRAALTGQELTEDFACCWRFHGDGPW